MEMIVYKLEIDFNQVNGHFPLFVINLVRRLAGTMGNIYTGSAHFDRNSAFCCQNRMKKHTHKCSMIISLIHVQIDRAFRQCDGKHVQQKRKDSIEPTQKKATVKPDSSEMIRNTLKNCRELPIIFLFGRVFFSLSSAKTGFLILLQVLLMPKTLPSKRKCVSLSPCWLVVHY